MTIRSKPYTDNDSNLPLCFRCLNSNPLTNLKGDKCNICSYHFVRSFISYEILPLIEFKPVKGISTDQAIEFIKFANSSTKKTTVEYF